MHPAVVPWHRLFACARGSTMVGYSSLVLLVAIAAITLLGRADAVGDKTPRPAATVSSN